MSTTNIGTSIGQFPPPQPPRTRHGASDFDAIGTPEVAADAAVSPEPADGPHVGSWPVVRTWVAGVIGLALLLFAGWWSTRTASASQDWGQITIFLAMFALMVIAGLLLIPALQKAWGWLKDNTKNLTVAVVIAALFVAVVAGLVAAAGHASADPASECRNWQQYKKQQWAKQTGRPVSQAPYFACPAPPPPPIQTTVPPTTWAPGQGEEPGDTANPGAVPGQENGPRTSVNNQVPSGNPTVTAPGHPARTPNQVPVPPVATSDVPAPTGQRPGTSPLQPTTTAVTPTTTTTPGVLPEGTATNTDDSPVVTVPPTQHSTGSGEYSLAFNQPDGSGVSPVVPAAMLAAAAALGVVTLRRNNARTALSKVGLTEGVSPLDTLAQGYLEGTVGPSDLVLMLNPTAPREYVFDEDVPPGGRIVVNPDGSATVYDAAGNPVKTIATPWAYDALGRPQPTWYTVNDQGQLVQHVAPNDDAVYPILADPMVAAIDTGDGHMIRYRPLPDGSTVVEGGSQSGYHLPPPDAQNAVTQENPRTGDYTATWTEPNTGVTTTSTTSSSDGRHVTVTERGTAAAPGQYQPPAGASATAPGEDGSFYVREPIGDGRFRYRKITPRDNGGYKEKIVAEQDDAGTGWEYNESTGRAETTGFDEQGQPYREDINPAGDRTRVTQTEDPNHPTEVRVYDSAGNKKSLVLLDADGNPVQQLTFGADGNANSNLVYNPDGSINNGWSHTGDTWTRYKLDGSATGLTYNESGEVIQRIEYNPDGSGTVILPGDVKFQLDDIGDPRDETPWYEVLGASERIKEGISNGDVPDSFSWAVDPGLLAAQLAGGTLSDTLAHLLKESAASSGDDVAYAVGRAFGPILLVPFTAASVKSDIDSGMDPTTSIATNSVGALSGYLVGSVAASLAAGTSIVGLPVVAGVLAGALTTYGVTKGLQWAAANPEGVPAIPEEIGGWGLNPIPEILHSFRGIP